MLIVVMLTVSLGSLFHNVMIAGKKLNLCGMNTRFSFKKAKVNLPPRLHKDRDTLIEQSNILLKQSVSQLYLANLPSWRMHAYWVVLWQTCGFGHQSSAWLAPSLKKSWIRP